MKWAMGTLAVLLVSALSWGATLRVPGEFPTIQAAVDASSPGDVILIAPGEYPEGVEIDHDLALIGEGEVTITGGPLGFVAGISVRAGEVSLQGITLEGGLLAEEQAVVHAEGCRFSSVTVSDWSRVELVDSRDPQGSAPGEGRNEEHRQRAHRPFHPRSPRTEHSEPRGERATRIS